MINKIRIRISKLSETERFRLVGVPTIGKQTPMIEFRLVNRNHGVTIEIIKAIRVVALIGTAKAIEIAESATSSRTQLHRAKRMGIATDHKPTGRHEAVLEDKLNMALTAVEEDLRVREIFPLRRREREDADVIPMFPHLFLLLRDRLILILLRIRTVKFKFPLELV